MEKINNVQLKEVVRDFLLTPSSTQPLIVWGKSGTGKTAIIEGVIREMQFYKLLKEEQVFSQSDIKLYKNKIGPFNSNFTVKNAFDDLFSCCRMISTEKSDISHFIIQANIKDEDADLAIIDAVNQQCNALSYKYELSVQDWCEWAYDTRKIHSCFVRFVRENPQWLHYYSKECDRYTTPELWESASKEIYAKLAFSEKNHDIYDSLCHCVSLFVYPAYEDFCHWIETLRGKQSKN